MSDKPLVLVVSGAGATGVSILQGLVKAGKWVCHRLVQNIHASDG